MKKGLKIFVFATAMLLTVGALKATIGHRYGFSQMGGCHSQRFHQRGEMNNCDKFNRHDDAKSNAELIPSPKN